MAISICAKCENNFFEIKKAEPRDSNYKVFFVQCSGCGAVAGVLDYENPNVRLDKLERFVRKIAKALNVDLDR